MEHAVDWYHCVLELNFASPYLRNACISTTNKVHFQGDGFLLRRFSGGILKYFVVFVFRD